MMAKRKYKYRVYNSDTNKQMTVMATSMEAAKAQGRSKIDTKKGIIKANRVK